MTNTITAGITVQNMGTKLGPDPLPLLVKAGADSRFFKDRLILALDGDAWVKDEKFSGAFGTEIWLATPLRCGPDTSLVKAPPTWEEPPVCPLGSDSA